MQRLSLRRMALNSLWAQRTQRVLAGSIHMTKPLEQSENGEQRIANLLKSKLQVDEIVVRDISGGCGSMYEIFVVSQDFKDKRTVQQHRLVNEILKDEVKQMHGLRIHTKVPD